MYEDNFLDEFSMVYSGISIFLVVYFLITLIAFIICIVILKKNNRGIGWAFLCFGSPVVGIIVTAVLCKIKKRDNIKNEIEINKGDWICPICGQVNKDINNYCYNCGEQKIKDDEKFI